ncbi:TetR/AcrR family transcriptional regulator [Streptomyces sp. NPDC059175]|uniref:TetR/AcrR family transcriptional regulator n=1 Tax=Streptomyces sp. NPDC059175 TaxID=3346757 RepID=UPI0036A76EFD
MNAESGTRSRTRRAILDAASSVLARDRRAPVAAIAKAADVGRSTLHRYFPDREQLVLTAALDSLEMIDGAVRDAATDEGAPAEAMRRLTTALVGLGDRLLFVFGDPQLIEEVAAEEGGEGDVEPLVLALISRGQLEGVFDSGVSAEWIMQVLWAMVYAGAEAAQRGTVPRHGVTAHVIRTLERGILAPEANGTGP